MNVLLSSRPKVLREGWPDQVGRWPQRWTARKADASLSRLGDSELRARPEGCDLIPETERKAGDNGRSSLIRVKFRPGGRDYQPQHVRSRLDHGNEASGRVYS